MIPPELEAAFAYIGKQAVQLHENEAVKQGLRDERDAAVQTSAGDNFRDGVQAALTIIDSCIKEAGASVSLTLTTEQTKELMIRKNTLMSVSLLVNKLKET